jgi:hypothetical protein
VCALCTNRGALTESPGTADAGGVVCVVHIQGESESESDGVCGGWKVRVTVKGKSESGGGCEG